MAAQSESMRSSDQRLQDELRPALDVRLASEEFSQEEPSAAFRLDDKISSIRFARSPERYPPYLRLSRRTVTVSGQVQTVGAFPLNQALSLLISAVLLANSSALHGQEVHASAE